jgi:DcuC family C4-dicarboxylate transporter
MPKIVMLTVFCMQFNKTNAMALAGIWICLVVVSLTILLLVKKYHAAGVLFLSGMVMMASALLLGKELDGIESGTGIFIFDFFELIRQSFSNKGAGVGLMIMTIGGYVAYMDKIGASGALVYVALKPLSVFKKQPYLLASLVIPLGHLLSIPIPSATGLGLLLIASVFPVLIKLGVSRVAAVSVIVSTTVFDMGPASANTLLAADLVQKSNMNYFLEDQLPMAIPLIVLMSILYYFINRYFDRNKEQETEVLTESLERPDAPLWFGLLPILPLVLLLVFSDFFGLFPESVKLTTTMAMLLSLGVACVFVSINLKDAKAGLATLPIFWSAMGRVFATIVVLIVAAEVFSSGLISLGFINFLIGLAGDLGLEIWGITILMSMLLFMASMLMGSGNASFFSFGPLVPEIAARMGAESARIILPMQLSSSLGRAISPIAGVIIATAEIAKVTPMQIVKRNFIPLTITMIVMMLLAS